ncbi:hypothetical protein B0B48_03820 [Lactobacillus gasseri]|jgi:hypothetical protein|uniref:hypothetical protein n=1 Tax=Lactobacillus gasseri TaxID=1596 RepID=UPI0009863509|nr:hypothetical protein [Lactobacillus gasseri]OOK86936.1 hypothetical protein B0B48_03820 [Lactobacillus gasseri]DAE66939.1 MAG TPA: hypothetical protein [Caudoviricetes sp.]
MKNIVFTLEFDDIYSNEHANEHLQKGWTLLHVGTKLVNSDEPADYETSYVVGANAEQYAEYQKEQEKTKNAGQNVKDWLNNN